VRPDPRLQRIGLGARMCGQLRLPAVADVEIAQHRRRQQHRDGGTAADEAGKPLSISPMMENSACTMPAPSRATAPATPTAATAPNRSGSLDKGARSRHSNAATANASHAKPLAEKLAQGPVPCNARRQRDDDHHQLGHAQDRRHPRPAAQVGNHGSALLMRAPGWRDETGTRGASPPQPAAKRRSIHWPRSAISSAQT
jgi:hypothetical protein